MHRDGHVHRHRGSPEAVILRRRVPLGTGQDSQDDPLQPLLGTVLHLGNRVIHVGPRDHPQANQAVRRHSTVFLRQPIVIGPDDRLVDLVVGDVAPQHWPGHHGGEQHLGVQPIHVLLPHALLRRTGASRLLDFDTKGLPLPFGSPSTEI